MSFKEHGHLLFSNQTECRHYPLKIMLAERSKTVAFDNAVKENFALPALYFRLWSNSGQIFNLGINNTVHFIKQLNAWST